MFMENIRFSAFLFNVIYCRTILIFSVLALSILIFFTSVIKIRLLDTIDIVRIAMIYKFIIYPSMLSVLILLISQSVIRCSGSPHCGFLNPYHPSAPRLIWWSVPVNLIWSVIRHFGSSYCYNNIYWLNSFLRCICNISST